MAVSPRWGISSMGPWPIVALLAGRMAVLLVALLTGCGATFLPAVIDQEKLGRKYPRDRFLTARGNSKESLAGAEDNARSKVCGQIQSEIRSVSKSWVKTIQEGTKIQSASGLDRVVVVTVPKCDLARFIAIAPNGSWKDAEGYWAHAYLERNTSEAWLREQCSADWGVLKSALQRMRMAFTPENDLKRFAHASGEALFAVRRLGPKMAQRRVIIGRDTPELERYRRSYSEILRLRSELRSRIRVGIVPSTQIGLRPAKVRDWVARMLDESGLAHDQKPGCHQSRPGLLRILLELDLQAACQHNPLLGRACEVTVDAVARDCRDRGVLFRCQLGGPATKSIESYDDMARQKAYRKLTRDMVVPQLLEELSSHLPVRRSE